MLKFVPDKKLNRIAFRSIKTMPRNVENGIHKAFMDVRKELKPATIKSMKEKKSGRQYWIYIGRGGRVLKHGKWHVASSPKETPAIMTGALSRSLGYQSRRGKGLTYGASTPYARRWELSQRSYLRRTIVENERNTERHLSFRIQQAILWRHGRSKKK